MRRLETLHLRCQRGMAVVAALVIVFAAAALAASAVQRQADLTGVLVLERDIAQGHWALQGGLDWARVLLFEQARLASVTHAGELWAQPLAGLPVGPADDPQRLLFSGLIEDEQGKLNLANLVKDRRIQADWLLVLKRLLQSLELPASLADTLLQRIQAQASGQAMMLRGLDDLAAPGMVAPAVLQRLQAHLTILPQATAVNVNTASAEVLAAVLPELGPGGARRLVARRDAGQWFVNRADFARHARLTLPPRDTRLGVGSGWFRVTGEVRAGDAISSLRALLQRDGQGRCSPRWVVRS